MIDAEVTASDKDGAVRVPVGVRASPLLVMPRGTRERVIAGVLVVLTVGALVVHAVAFYRWFFVDDAFISMRYAQRFARGQGLTWTDGERVEGYSNFLWTVMIGLLGVFTPERLVDIARVFGIVCMSLALVLVLLGNLPRTVRTAFPVLAIGLALAGSGPVAAWATGGLEQSLLGAMVVAGFVLLLPRLEQEAPSFRDIAPAATALSLAVLTRPDACLFTATACVGLVVVRKFRPSALASAARLACIPLAVFVTHLAFRRLYYGSWVPNTYHAKVAVSVARAREGLTYVTSAQTPVAFLPPLVLTAGAAILDSKRRRRVVFLLLPLLSWIAYVIGVGGDIMPERRHLVLAFLLLALLDLEGLTFVASWGRLLGPIVAHVFALGTLCFAASEWHRDPQREPVTRDPWEWNGVPVGRFLKEAFAKADPLLAVDAAGSTPYYSELDALDLLGLNDAYLAHHPPPSFGKGPLGHELGDAKYVLGRKPDIVMFHVPPGQWDAMWPADRQMQQSDDFRAHYAAVRFETPWRKPLQALLWIRQEGGRIGIDRQQRRVVVPGYFLSGKEGPPSRFDDERRLGTAFPRDAVASFSLWLETGTWSLSVDATGTLEAPSLSLPGHLDAESSSTLQVVGRQDVVVQLRAAAEGEAFVRSFTLVRTD